MQLKLSPFKRHYKKCGDISSITPKPQNGMGCTVNLEGSECIDARGMGINRWKQFLGLGSLITQYLGAPRRGSLKTAIFRKMWQTNSTLTQGAGAVAWWGEANALIKRTLVHCEAEVN